MSVENALAGFQLLSKGFKDYGTEKAAKQKAAQELLRQQKIDEANKKLGSDLLADPLATSSPESRFAAQALQSGTIDAEKAMGAFGKLTPEQQILFYTNKAFMSKDPELMAQAKELYNGYANTQYEKSRQEAKGKMQGSIEGGALLLKAAGKKGGGGGGGGGSAGESDTYQGQQQMFRGGNIYGGINFEDPALKATLVDMNGKPITIDPSKGGVLSQVGPIMKPDQYRKFSDVLRENIRKSVATDPTLARTGNPNYIEQLTDQAQDTLMRQGKSGFYKKIVRDPRNPKKIISYEDDADFPVLMDAQDMVNASMRKNKIPTDPDAIMKALEDGSITNDQLRANRRFKKIKIGSKDLGQEK